MVVKAWLEGDAFDLDLLVSLLPTGDTRVEPDGNGGYFLVAAEIDNRSAGVTFYEAADVALERINGLGRVANGAYRPIRLSGRYEDGAARHQVVKVGVAECRDLALPITAMINGQPAPQPPSPWAHHAAIAATQPDVAEALSLLGQSDPADWVALYKVYEIIDHSGRLSAAAQAAGIADADLKRFKHTACHPQASGSGSRHSRSRQAPPKKPMALGEARNMINVLVNAWIATW